MNPLTLINYVPCVNVHYDPGLFIQIKITLENNVALTDKNNHINNIFFFLAVILIPFSAI